MELPFRQILCSVHQFKTFFKICQLFFLCFKAEKLEDYEVVYHLLKFCLLIKNRKEENLLLLLKKTPVFHSESFWMDLYVFLSKYLKIEEKSQNQK